MLDRGEKIAEGGPDDIRNNQRVIEAYLGKSGTEGSGTDDRHDEPSGEPVGDGGSRCSASTTCTSTTATSPR